jgi:hypothetical protein
MPQYTATQHNNKKRQKEECSSMKFYTGICVLFLLFYIISVILHYVYILLVFCMLLMFVLVLSLIL